jgi:serine protease Do
VAIATDVGSGSGVVWSADGYIVTNHHVIDGARSVKVMLANNEEYPATIIGSNAENDLALLRINVTGLLPAQLGNSDALRMGQPVVAIGNPLGTLSNTATEGIVSATSREITVEGQTMTLMQISAPINPGNSGGGCFDINGRLIGIVNAKTSAAGIEGLGFAIPVNTAKTVIGAMLSKDNTTLQKGVGVTGCYEITEENYADFADIELLKQIERLQGEPLYGIYIISDDMVDYVDPNGNVFENGDVLHKINGKEVKTLADVAKIVNDCSVGQELAITVLRLMQSGNVLRPTYSLVEYSFQIRVIQMYK